MKIKANTVIEHLNGDCDALYLVTEGYLSVLKEIPFARNYAIRIAYPGAITGNLRMQENYQESLRALSNCTLLKLYAKEVDWLHEDVYQAAVNKEREDIEKGGDRPFVSVALAQLAHTIIYINSVVPPGNLHKLVLRHYVLAEFCTCTRETVTRNLNKLIRQGVVDSSLAIKDEEKLHLISQGK